MSYLTRAQSCHKELVHPTEAQADYQAYLNLLPEDVKPLYTQGSQKASGAT